MKKIVISSIFALFMQLSYSQIQIQQPDSRVIVGKYNSGAYTHSELSYRIKDDKDTLYTLIFLNAEYRVIKEYTSIQFSGENNTCNQLYLILKSFFSDENKKNKEYKVNFQLGEMNVTASIARAMGITNVMLYTKGGFTYFTEKEINKLFGKLN